MQKYLEIAVSSLKEAVIFNLGGVIVALAVLLVFGIPLSISFGFILLIESTALMLVGGALGVAGQATSRKVLEMVSKRKVDPKSVAVSDLKAALYALTGILLFVEGAVLAAIFA